VDVTPAHVAAAYALLRSLPPFSSWNLPAEGVTFDTSAAPHEYGDYLFEGGTHRLRISRARHTHIYTILCTLAHEMCHMKLAVDGEKTWNRHGKHWRSRANEVCTALGFDPGEFGPPAV
jgi:hypothetical protein